MPPAFVFGAAQEPFARIGQLGDRLLTPHVRGHARRRLSKRERRAREAFRQLGAQARGLAARRLERGEHEIERKRIALGDERPEPRGKRGVHTGIH